MLHVSHLSLPANTTTDAPVVEIITPGGRYVQSVEIAFPASTSYNVGVRLKDRGMRWAPALGSADEWIRADNQVVKWNERFKLTGMPFELGVEGYNTNGAGTLEVEVRVNIHNRDLEADGLELIGALYELLKKWLTGGKHESLRPEADGASQNDGR